MALAKVGENDIAVESATMAIRLDPRFARAYGRRARIRKRLGDRALAELDERRAAELDPRLTFVESAVRKNVLRSLQRRDESLQSSGKTFP